MQPHIGFLIDESATCSLVNTLHLSLNSHFKLFCGANFNYSKQLDFEFKKFDLFAQHENRDVNHISYLNSCLSVVVVCNLELVDKFLNGINDNFILASLSAFKDDIYFCVNSNNIKQINKMQEKLHFFSRRFNIINMNDKTLQLQLQLIELLTKTFEQKILWNKNILFVDLNNVSYVDEVRVIENKSNLDLNIYYLKKLINLGANVSWMSNFEFDLRGCYLYNLQQLKDINLQNFDAIIYLTNKFTYQFLNTSSGKISSKINLNLDLIKENVNIKTNNSFILFKDNDKVEVKINNFDDLI